MNLEFIKYSVWALAALIVIYHIVKGRGLKGAMFGSPITGTVGEVDLGKNGPMHTMLKLHYLEARVPGAPTVGIQVVNRSPFGYSTSAIRLTSEQAAILRELLSQASSRQP